MPSDFKKKPSETALSHADLASVIVDEMYQFVALLDKDGRLLEVNRPALEGTGLRMSDVRGQYMWEVPVWNVTPENFIRVREASLRGCAGEFVREELQLFAAAGGKEVVTIDFSIKPVRDKEGKIQFVLAEGRNITERKVAEAEVERKNQELAELNGKLQELDRLKTEFFANVSHELRTPLSLILGPAQQLLHRENLPEFERRDLELVERNARLLLKHVNDLLDISRLEARAMSLQYSRCDLAWLGRFVASFFDGLAKDKMMNFTVSMPESVAADLDIEKTQRVLLNILSNAFKFTPDGGSVRFSTGVSGEKVVMTVEDSGPGIPERLIPVVFERFRQVEGSSSRRYGGTGLGLSIVKEFAELHGGTVTIENVLPHGLKVSVELPLSAPTGFDVRPTPTDGNSEIASTFVEELGYRATPAAADAGSQDSALPLVLIVEDNEDVREFLQEILSRKYRTVCAQNGAEGLSKTLAMSPSLIITDVMMPEMSGEEMVMAIRKQAGLNEVPILMLTARVDEELRVRMFEQGVQDFVTKPFAPKELIARVGRLLQERQNAELNLKRSEERYRTLVEATTSVVWVTNAKGEIDSPQSSWQQYTGQTSAEAAKLGWLLAVHADDREAFKNSWLDAVQRENFFSAEGRIWSVKHGMFRYFVARGISLRTNDGGVREWVCTIYDTHERTTMDQRLRLSLQEKETLLKEMHHRVKNNMQVIASLLRLQAMNVEEQKLQSILEESQNRIRAMALVHEKLYQSQTISRIDFADYLSMLAKELVANLSSSRGDITLELDIDRVDLSISKAIPCGLLVNELISNCLKHGFPSGKDGTVTVLLKKLSGNDVLLSISDNGVGLPENIELAKPKSLGIQIVSTLANQLGGKLECDRSSGLRWSITFDASYEDEVKISGLGSEVRKDSMQ